MRRLVLAGAAASRRAAALPLAGISVGSALFVALLGRLGVLSLPGIAALAALGAALLLVIVYGAPWLLVIVTPAILPIRNVWTFLPFEVALYLLTAVVIVRGARTQASWLFRLQPVESAYLALILWAAFTGLWCEDFRLWMWGIRRIGVGLLGFWVAYRLASLIPRRVFEWSLMALAVTLASSAMFKRSSLGFSQEALMLHRSQATDLGWGTANYIAGILLLLAPVLVTVAPRESWAPRAAAWGTLGLTALLQILIASRAALVLFIGGIAAQVAASVRRSRRWVAGLVALSLVGAVLAGPWSSSILFRLTSLRELGSMTIRIWYFREGWRRTLDALPWGIGVNQGPNYPDHLQGTDPHNYWLVLGSELGILGVAGWVIVLALLWRGASRLVADREWAPEGRALQIVFVIAQLHTLVEPTFQGAQYQFVFFWIFGGLLGYHALWTRGGAGRAPGAAPAASSSDW